MPPSADDPVVADPSRGPITDRPTIDGSTIEPADCRTMIDVRAGVDAIDEALVVLIARRFRYMDAAARIKPERGHVRDEARKAAVIANARRVAAREGAPAGTVAALYERLVEDSIAHELARFDSR